MNHWVLGAGIPFAIAAVVYVARGRRATRVMLILVPVCMGLCMTWAAAPDIPRLWSTELADQLTKEQRCDVFFWHYSIDQIETESRVYVVLFMLMVLSVLFAAWRELRLAERGD